MVKSTEEIMQSIRDKLGEDTSDETLTLLEDVSDTIGELKKKADDTTNWAKKFEDNDKQWRQRYHDRFFSSEASDEDPSEEGRPKEPLVRFEDLFTKEGE